MSTNPKSCDAGKPAPAKGLHAWHNPTAIGCFIFLTLAGLATDLISKHMAFDRLLSARENLPAEIDIIRTQLAAKGNDQPESRAILHYLDVQQPTGIPHVKFTLSTNPGVVFGLPMPRVVVVLISIAMTAVVTFFFLTSDIHHRWLHVALALILAGALGNLYDRVFAVVALPGIEPIRYQVRDFIDCTALKYPWIFNIADVLLVQGMSVIVAHRLVYYRRVHRKRLAAAKAARAAKP
ncbi:MAG: signal peptidase II [Planctomycetota bacterium]